MSLTLFPSLRLRRKNWKNPGRVYVDNQVFEENIKVYASFEVFLEILEGLSFLLKCPCNKKKISSFFSSDFESVFAKHPTGKILSFDFCPKAVYFECKFWITLSAISHVQN